jgi:hypothetical protein
MERQAGMASLMSPRERAVLAVVCDALHPALPAGAGDNAVLFGTSASDLEVPGAAERAIELLGDEQRAELRQFLRLIDNSLFGLVVSFTPSGIRRMTPGQRERLLLRLATSRVP